MKAFKLTLLALSLSACLGAQSEMTSPVDFFGFEPGSDRNLITYDQLIGYLKKLDGESDRILMQQAGASTLGRPMYICFISSPKNLQKLEELKGMNRELALNPEIGKAELRNMMDEGKVFVTATLSMHSTEVGPSQAAPLAAYELALTTDPEKEEWLSNVVYMMVPCHNPDGMDMVVNNYLEHKGTKYEGASLPRVYHKYVGHNINRDFVTLSQAENRVVDRIFSQTWFPQVMVEKHQMGSTGTRYFVPPNHDPIAENVPAGVFHWTGVFGQHMATDMTADGLAGVSQHYIFDNYWPGSTETCIWKNMIGFLTEAASCRTASPVYVEPGELRVGGKGLSEYKKSVNMLEPWEGGWWRLSDIVAYELSSTRSILKTASLYRRDILDFRNRMCREQVELGRTEAPYYYILPGKQHDQGEFVNLVNLLGEHGVSTYTLESEQVLDGRVYEEGSIVIPLSQPFRPFIKEVMEAQVFPERHYTPGGELIKPYDISSWSLPLHRGVRSEEIDQRSMELEAKLKKVEGPFTLTSGERFKAEAMLLPAASNESFRAAFRALSAGMQVRRLTEEQVVQDGQYGRGSFVIYKGEGSEAWEAILDELPFEPGTVSDPGSMPAEALELPRIGLVETYFHDMDAGWTRYLFDSYHLPYTVLNPDQIKDENLAKDFDVLIFPDRDKDLLMSGKRKSGGRYYMSSYHPDQVKGLGKEGMEKLMGFSDAGGLIIAWGGSTGLFEGMLSIKSKEGAEEFNLPFRDLSTSLSGKGLYIPGSLLRVKLLQDHPLTLGMPESLGVFSRGRPVFQTGIPMFDMDRRVIGTYPEKEVLISGYAAEEELLGNKAAMVWMKKGKGQFVFFGFGPQFRGSTQASFKLLFNAVLLDPPD